MAEKKSPGTAVLCSFFFCGLGQIYCGEILRGLLFMFGAPIALVVFFLFTILFGSAAAQTGADDVAGGAILGGFVVMLIGPFIVWTWNLYDAYTLALTINARGNRHRAKARRKGRGDRDRRSDDRRDRSPAPRARNTAEERDSSRTTKAYGSEVDEVQEDELERLRNKLNEGDPAPAKNYRAPVKASKKPGRRFRP